MKVIGPVVLVLIAGTLSSTNASGLDQAIRSLCDKNGRPNFYKSIQNTTANAKSTIEYTIREIAEGVHNIHNEIDAVITLYCGKVGILSNSVDVFVEAVTLCLEPGDLELAYMRNFTVSLLQFPCANRNLVKDVFNNADRQCLASKLEGMANCGRIMFAAHNTTIDHTSSSGSESNGTIILTQLESRSGNQTCSDVQSFEECTVRVIAECEDQIFSTTLNSMYKYINNDLFCENLPKTSSFVNLG